MTITPAQKGFIHGIAIALLSAVLIYLGDASHLTMWVSVPTATLIAALAMAIEENIQSSTGKALFGTVHVLRAR